MPFKRQQVWRAVQHLYLLYILRCKSFIRATSLFRKGEWWWWRVASMQFTWYKIMTKVKRSSQAFSAIVCVCSSLTSTSSDPHIPIPLFQSSHSYLVFHGPSVSLPYLESPIPFYFQPPIPIPPFFIPPFPRPLSDSLYANLSNRIQISLFQFPNSNFPPTFASMATIYTHFHLVIHQFSPYISIDLFKSSITIPLSLIS